MPADLSIASPSPGATRFMEVADAMAGPDGLAPILAGIRIHPALSEVLTAAVGNLREEG